MFPIDCTEKCPIPRLRLKGRSSPWLAATKDSAWRAILVSNGADEFNNIDLDSSRDVVATVSSISTLVQMVYSSRKSFLMPDRYEKFVASKLEQAKEVARKDIRKVAVVRTKILSCLRKTCPGIWKKIANLTQHRTGSTSRQRCWANKDCGADHPKCRLPLCQAHGPETECTWGPRGFGSKRT